MFTESDEVFIWAKKGKRNKVYKLNMSAAVKLRFIEVFNNGTNSLIKDENGEDCEHISFETNYTVYDSEEIFIINGFVIPQELKDAIDNPDVIESYIPKDEQGRTEEGYDIRSIIIGKKTDQEYYFAGQRFTQRQIVVKPRGFNLLFQQNMFVEENQGFSINIRENVDCLYVGTGLVFKKYTDANGVFDLSEYYRTASQHEVDEFSGSSAFDIEDVEAFARSVAGISIRKKIAKIIDLGTLNDITQIKLNVDKVNIDIEFSEDGNKVKIPDDKKKLKRVMAFLAEELYPGLFTNTTYLSNSTRKID